MTASAAVFSVAFFFVSLTVVPSFYDCGRSFRESCPVVPGGWIILEIYER